MVIDSILWRRLDVPGHDACRLERNDVGWELHGMAIFRQGGTSVGLAYHVASDLAWRTHQGRVRGWLGAQSVEFNIARSTKGTWTLNGAAVSGLESCIDLDLGFTPATNLLPLRRLALAEGQTTDVPAAWLDVMSGTLERLLQRYERRAEDTYWYEVRSVDYAALLEVSPSGFIRNYPGLWEVEP